VRIKSYHLALSLLLALPILLFVASRIKAGQAAPAESAAEPAAQTRILYADGAPQLEMLRIESVAVVPFPASEPLSARMAYDEDVTARIFPGVSGRLEAIRVQPGDTVKSGQALAQLDASDFGSARADYEKAAADEARKQSAFDRLQDLSSDEAIALRELESARADLLAARAETERATRRLHNLNPRGLPTQGQLLVLTSPLSGVVTERNATPALEVAPGQASPVFVVSDLTHLWVFIDVPERYLPILTPGLHVSLESDSFPGIGHEATVSRIARVIDPATRRLSVRAAVDNRDGALLPEMFVRARLLARTASAVRVPIAALVQRGVGTYVYVETTPHEFERRSVEIARRDVDECYVSSGLANGERIVTSGALLLDAEVPGPAGAGT
jgi:cobalt-zinc-cadmium efflux system membrane fusion protein